MNDGIGKIRARLRNWGDYLVYMADHGPDKARCTSIESKHIPDADDIWEPPKLYATPNVADAEQIEATLKRLFEQGTLGVMDRYCLAVRWGGYAAVFRVKRVGDQAMQKLADNAELELYEALKKSA